MVCLALMCFICLLQTVTSSSPIILFFLPLKAKTPSFVLVSKKKKTLKKKTQTLLYLFIPQGCSTASWGLVPNIEPVSPVLPDKEPALGQESGSRVAPGACTAKQVEHAQEMFWWCNLS